MGAEETGRGAAIDRSKPLGPGGGRGGGGMLAIVGRGGNAYGNGVEVGSCVAGSATWDNRRRGRSLSRRERLGGCCSMVVKRENDLSERPFFIYMVVFATEYTECYLWVC